VTESRAVVTWVHWGESKESGEKDETYEDGKMFIILIVMMGSRVCTCQNSSNITLQWVSLTLIKTQRASQTVYVKIPTQERCNEGNEKEVYFNQDFSQNASGSHQSLSPKLPSWFKLLSPLFYIIAQIFQKFLCFQLCPLPSVLHRSQSDFSKH
jgi:hypothetical protein